MWIVAILRWCVCGIRVVAQDGIIVYKSHFTLITYPHTMPFVHKDGEYIQRGHHATERRLADTPSL